MSYYFKKKARVYDRSTSIHPTGEECITECYHTVVCLLLNFAAKYT